MKVLKFGGSSVARPDTIRRVVGVVRSALDTATSEDPPLVVVSALGGVTDSLLDAGARAARRDPDWERVWSGLQERHLAAAAELAGDDEALRLHLEQELDDLHDLLRGVFLLRELSARARDRVASYGERLSAQIVAAALRSADVAARAVDARELVRTDDRFGRARVDFDTTRRQVRAALASRDGVAVITGFLGATAESHTTTLGRGGSDYTAALVGAALDAEAIELWTDVDGVLSADPRLVETAFLQPTLSYAELMELSHFGAKVVYPPTVHPARSRGIPLWIKNTFRPEAPGTRVAQTAEAHQETAPEPTAPEPTAPEPTAPVRGISSIDRVALVRLEGAGMVGVPGIAARLFGALARADVSVILISQSSSEHSICFAVTPDDAEAARRAANREFAAERERGQIDDLVVEPDHAVLAAVGEGMAHQPGLAGRLFGTLGRHGVNVRAIAQGSSERNVSLVVRRSDQPRAVRALHRSFFEPPRRSLAIALLGAGGVGGALLDQLTVERERLAHEGLDLRLVAVADSRNVLTDPAGLDLATVRERLAERRGGAERLELATLGAFLAEALERGGAETRAGGTSGARVVVDCTAADGLESLYRSMLRSGIGVVAANKKPFSGPSDALRSLRDAARFGRAPLLHETTVGAGLPVLGPLADQVRTGDRPRRIDAVLSGSVATVLDRLDASTPLSRAVTEAAEAGLTEPNPWDDLSGADVARKLVILARTAGASIEPEDVRIDPLLDPARFSGLDLETFWRRLPEVDADFEARRARAESAGRRLRFIASLELEPGEPVAARVGLEAVGPEHPAYGLAGADNLVAITSERYAVRPLVVRGPGAGREVTAAGVFADLLAAAARLDP